MEMKNYRYMGALIFVIVCSMLVFVPVSGAPVSQDINIQSGVTEFFFCEITPGSQVFPLAIGDNEMAGNNLHCSSNTGYLISAYDTGAGNKFTNVPGSQGKMVMVDMNSGGMTVALTNAFEVKYNGGEYHPLTATDQIIYTSVPGEQDEPVWFKQVITPFDPVPATTSPLPTVYQIDIRVTCSPVP